MWWKDRVQKSFLQVEKWLIDFSHLLYPVCCAGCDRPLYLGEHLLCTSCRYHLPITDFHLDPINEGVQLLGGQFPLDFVLCYLRFEEASRVQNMVHNFKYRGGQELGFGLGKAYGELLCAVEHACLRSDILLPIPMQVKKLKKRGYNQAEVFANGISEATKIPLRNDLLSKSPKVQTQVGKSRAARFENLEKAYEYVGEADELKNQSVILVDDVLTSGATIAACAQVVLEAGAKSIGVITLARKRN